MEDLYEQDRSTEGAEARWGDAWVRDASFQATPYSPTGMPARVRGRTRLACGAVDSADATLLPTATTDPDRAITAVFTAARLDAAERGLLHLDSLRPIARVVGSGMLLELVSRLKDWTPQHIATGGPTGGDIRRLPALPERLAPRLILHVVAHFRELARRAPNAGEAHVLEAAGWLLAARLRDDVQRATSKNWWLPAAPSWAVKAPDPAPGLTPALVTSLRAAGLLAAGGDAASATARAAWTAGLAGLQWQQETRGTDPWKLFYPSIVRMPAAPNVAGNPGPAAWATRLASVWGAMTCHTGVPTFTPACLTAANTLRTDASGAFPSADRTSASMGGLQIVGDFPIRAGARLKGTVSCYTPMRPLFEALFTAIRELGWNDLFYAHQGGLVFRGIRHPVPSYIPPGGGRPQSPLEHPNLAGAINAEWTPRQKLRLQGVLRVARLLSNHGRGEAIDINTYENEQGVTARRHGSLDPRVVAIFEAYGFRWGGCYATAPDPMHFEYVGRLPQATGAGWEDAYGDPMWRQGGNVFLNAGAGRTPSGVHIATGDWVTVDSAGRIADAASAVIGTLLPTRERVLRMKRATLAATSTPGQFTPTTSGPVLAGLDDGSILLEVDARKWKSADLSLLAPARAARLSRGCRIDLTSGARAIWMRYRISDERAPTPRFELTKATMRELEARRDLFLAEAARLPAGALRTQIEGRAPICAAVSVVEGSFGSRAGPGDSFVSLGIFQWGMARTAIDAGSLGTFFSALKGRAGQGGVYAGAWRQCTALGLDVTAGGAQITINGRPATGIQVDALMGPVMATADLKTYQMVASNDWIDVFLNKVVRVAGKGDEFLGAGHRFWNDRVDVARSGQHIRVERPTTSARLGDVFTSQRAIASALLLGVNRPAWVATSLWRGLTAAADPRATLHAEADRLLAAMAAASRRAGRGGFRATDVAAVPAAAAPYRALQALLFPPATLPTGGEAELLERFEFYGIGLYPAADARKYRRAGRFATAALLEP